MHTHSWHISYVFNLELWNVHSSYYIVSCISGASTSGAAWEIQISGNVNLQNLNGKNNWLKNQPIGHVILKFKLMVIIWWLQEQKAILENETLREQVSKLVRYILIVSK